VSTISRLVSALIVGAGLLSSCTGGAAAVADAAPSDAADDGSTVCAIINPAPLPPEPEMCAAMMPGPCPELKSESCAYPTLEAVVQNVARDCGVYCGVGAVGFRNRCAVSLAFTKIGTVQGTTVDQALDCLRRRLIGASWLCAPSSAIWVRVFLGSCTIP
jgi:hypothetical protein